MVPLHVMPAYLAPGVYLRPKRTDLPDVHTVRTDVAGFVGFAERGPLPLVLGRDPQRIWRAEDLAVRLTSWDEFRAIFGGVTPYGYLAYAVRGFFENGGTTCHVVRVGAVDAKEPGERPALAQWAFPAATTDAAFTTTLATASVSGDRTLTLGTAFQAGEASLVDIGSPTGGLVERHVLREVTGVAATLDSPLRASFPAGSLVVGRKAALAVEAVTAGSWGNRIGLRLEPLGSGEDIDSFSLRVTVDRGPDREHPREEEFYREVSLNPASPAYIATVVNPRSRLLRFMTPAASSPTSFLRIERPLGGVDRIRLEGGRDGLRGITADDFGLVDLGDDKPRGLRALEAIDQVSILCAPDVVFETQPWKPPPPVPTAPCAPPPMDEQLPPPPPDETAVPAAFDRDRVYGEMLAQCERRHDRVAILDPPPGARAAALLRWRDRFTSRFGATYAPWIRVPDPLQPPGHFRPVPPSGHMAGGYARTDLSEGVYRAPANLSLEGVADLVEPISTAQQEELNPYGVNALRAFPGRGVRVWGARSLAARDDPDWRFIHVRRLLSMIEESVEDSMQWTAFEPNDDRLRRTVVHALSLFLQAIWQRGGLDGALPEEGFYVKCDETNNPQAVIDAGQLVCQVGVAPAAPMEFIVFEVRQKPDGVDIVEL